MNKEEQELYQKRVEAMVAAPIALVALIKLLIDKGIITREELLDYIKKDKRINE